MTMDYFTDTKTFTSGMTSALNYAIHPPGLLNKHMHVYMYNVYYLMISAVAFFNFWISSIALRSLNSVS